MLLETGFNVKYRINLVNYDAAQFPAKKNSVKVVLKERYRITDYVIGKHEYQRVTDKRVLGNPLGKIDILLRTGLHMLIKKQPVRDDDKSNMLSHIRFEQNSKLKD
jgi:hypothetical protein